MPCFRGLDSLPRRPAGSTRVTWGVFDGVHLGHRAVLDAVVAWARADGAESVALTFDPHPQAFLRGVRIPLVMPVDERARCLAACGIGAVVVIPFDRSFADRSPESFVHDLLLGTLGAGGVVIGYDSTFGKGGKGTGDLLRRLAEGRGVSVRAPEPRTVGGLAVKSSRLRAAITAGDLAAARAMRGGPVELVGPVVRGAGRGRTIGVPTANIDCGGLVLPPNGVYAIRGQAADGRLPSAVCRLPPVVWGPADGVLNIGVRPTFGGHAAVSVEAHFFDPPAIDLHGTTLRIEVVERLREERKFDGGEALRAQIGEDCKRARSVLGRAAGPP